MKIKCPKDPAHNRFGVTAHVTQDWIVDECGQYVGTIKDCLEVTHYPDSEDYYHCMLCGAEAVVEDD